MLNRSSVGQHCSDGKTPQTAFCWPIAQLNNTPRVSPLASTGVEVGSGGAATPVAIPIAAGAITAAVEFEGSLTAEGCKIVANFFTNSKYRVVASDGTILLAVKKTNTAGIQELKKDGIDIEKLTHLSKGGVRMQDEP